MTDIAVTKYQNVEEISEIIAKIPVDRDEFVLDYRFLSLLKDTNKNRQDYYVIENNGEIAFCVLYRMRLNIFTYGKFTLYFPVKVVGLPCSVSQKGYVTKNKQRLFEFVKSITGAKLVLNCDENETMPGFTIGKTLPTCILKMNWNSIEDYLRDLRSNYRYRVKKAARGCKDIIIKKIDGSSFDERLYQLYLNTYKKSKYKLEVLDINFFKYFEGEFYVFENNQKPIGFHLLQQRNNHLYFMFCGMDYSYRSPSDLYYYMLLNIIGHGIKKRVDYIDFGQTSEQTKLRLGCKLRSKYFYANHSNQLINFLISKNVKLLEYSEVLGQYNVFKKEKK